MNHVETLKELYAAWNRRDVDTGVSLLHPEAEIRTSGDFPGMGSLYRGRDEARRFYDDLTGTWEQLDLNPHSYLDLGDGRMLTTYRFVGRGRGGITVEREAAQIVEFEDGLVRSMRTFGSWDLAREAAGLSDDTVAVLRELYETWSGDDLEAAVELFGEDVVYRTSGLFPDIQLEYRGHDGIRVFTRDFKGTFESLRIEPVRLEAIPGGAMGLARFDGRGRGGVRVEREIGHVARVEDGRVVELTAFASWDDALAAAGIAR